MNRRRNFKNIIIFELPTSARLFIACTFEVPRISNSGVLTLHALKFSFFLPRFESSLSFESLHFAGLTSLWSPLTRHLHSPTIGPLVSTERPKTMESVPTADPVHSSGSMSSALPPSWVVKSRTESANTPVEEFQSTSLDCTRDAAHIVSTEGLILDEGSHLTPSHDALSLF